MDQPSNGDHVSCWDFSNSAAAPAQLVCSLDPEAREIAAKPAQPPVMLISSPTRTNRAVIMVRNFIEDPFKKVACELGNGTVDKNSKDPVGDRCEPEHFHA